jgi:hypothetical protein
MRSELRRDFLASAFVYGGAAAMTLFVPALGLILYGNLKDNVRAQNEWE